MNILTEILRESDDLIYWKNINGDYLGCSNKFLEICDKQSIKEVIGSNNYQLFDFHVAEKLTQNDNKLFKEKKAITYEQEIINKTISKDIVIFTKRKILTDEKNNSIGILGLCQNITEIKRNELKLIDKYSTAKKYFKRMINEVQTPISWKNNDGKYIHCNQSFSKTFKLKYTDIVGNLDYDIFDFDMADKLKCNDNLLNNIGKRICLIEEFTISDCKKIFLTQRNLVTDEEKNTNSIVSVFIDITKLGKLNIAPYIL